VSVTLQKRLGMSFFVMEVSLIHGYFGKFNHFIQPLVCSRILCAHNLIMRILLIMHVVVSPAFVYCMLVFLQHLFLQFSYFVHVQF
jgi:hypothetical protein